MKVRTYVLVASAALLLMASGTKEAKPSVGLNPGDLAPRIELPREGLTIPFRNQMGRYTLLNFWAAYDGESRARNVQLANEVRKCASGKVEICSISLDPSRSVFKETVRTDRLEDTPQWQAGGEEAQVLYKQFKLEKGFRNFLINDKGVIIAANVTPKRLTEILKSI